VGDPGAIQIVNQAQADYVKAYIQANLSQYASLPVLSVSAPFKSGYEGGRDYTDVAVGNLAIFNAADLYLYVDSWNPGVAGGAVAESNEANNRAELHGLVVSGPNPKLLSLQSAGLLPERPALSRK